MPAAFDKCRSGGGKIRTKQLGGGKYMHVCILNGKSYAGEVKTKQSSTSSSGGESNVAKAMARRMK
jgi:hypothetical protein